MTTYYIKNGGNDTADGLSDANAWETIGKVNAQSPSAGDIFSFKRGSTFTDAILRTYWSGSSVASIQHVAYDTGARPVFSPNNTIPLYTDGVVRDYLEFNALDFAVTGTGNMAAQVELTNSTFEDCIFRDAVSRGLLLQAGSGNVTVNNCYAHNNGDWGIQLSPGAGTISSCTLTNNTCSSNGTDGAADHGIYCTTGTQGGHTIEGNTCYANAAGGIKLNSNSSPSTIARNNCYDNNYGIILSAGSGATNNGHMLRNNRLYSNTNDGIILINDGGSAADGVNDCFFYNNHIVNNAAGLTIAGVRFLDTGSTGNVFKNNLFYYDDALGGVPYLLRFPDSTTIGNQTFDYNDYWISGRSSGGSIIYDGSSRSFDYWQATAGQDANGKEEDPLFLVEYTDLHLPSSSPCVNAGVTVGLTQDYDGSHVPMGVAPDIGAYEFISEWFQTFRN